MREDARKSKRGIRQWDSEDLSRAFPFIRGLRTRLGAEAQSIYYMWRRGLVHYILQRRRQNAIRQRQMPHTWHAASALAETSGGWGEALRAAGIRYCEGSHVLYIPPQDGLDQRFGDFVRAYPADAGFKVLKNHGKPAEARYVRELKMTSMTRSVLVGTANDLVPVASALNDMGIGPRLYDVTHISVGGANMTAFVVQHIDGKSPLPDDCSEFMEVLRTLEDEQRLAFAVPNWQCREDFRCPDCNGNLLRSVSDGGLYYVDFQNFLIPNEAERLKRLTERARETAHCGTEVRVLGGRYLHQQIPGHHTIGKRDTSVRWERMKALLHEANVVLKNRLVLDVGCNTGLMMAQALNEGAHWGVGWDLPPITKLGAELLSILSYTRAWFVGAELHKAYSLEADIPQHLVPYLNESIVFYLSMRRHIGFIEGLRKLPWRYMIYEGHHYETGQHLEDVLSELQSFVPCTVVARTDVRDGASDPRPLLLLVRSSL